MEKMKKMEKNRKNGKKRWKIKQKKSQTFESKPKIEIDNKKWSHANESLNRTKEQNHGRSLKWKLIF